MLEETAVQKWRTLAFSELPAKRQLALDLAPSIADEIQDELTWWFFAQTNFAIKTQIYALLNEESRALIAEKEKDTTVPLSQAYQADVLPFIKDENLAKTYIKGCLRRHGKDYGYTSEMLWHIKTYMTLAECSLYDARNAVECDLCDALDAAIQQRAKK